MDVWRLKKSLSPHVYILCLTIRETGNHLFVHREVAAIRWDNFLISWFRSVARFTILDYLLVRHVRFGRKQGKIVGLPFCCCVGALAGE